MWTQRKPSLYIVLDDFIFFSNFVPKYLYNNNKMIGKKKKKTNLRYLLTNKSKIITQKKKSLTM